MRIRNLRGRIAASLMASGVLCGGAALGATTLTGLNITNEPVPTDHGSFEPGTPDIGLVWSDNWDQFDGWPNDPGDGVYQVDGMVHTVDFTPALGVQVALSSFDLNVWTGGGDTDVDWTLDGLVSGNLGAGTISTPDASVTSNTINLTGAAGEAVTLTLTQTSGLGSYLAMDNLAFDQIGAPANLTLQINEANGALAIKNDSQSNIDVDYYENRSDSDSLSTVGWASLQDQNLAGFPAGDGTGNGWEEAGGVGVDILSESYLEGMSTIASETMVGLGIGYDEAIGDMNIVFNYGLPSGLLVAGLVEYVNIPDPDDLEGDFNNSDLVEQGDLDLVLLNWGDPVPPTPNGWINQIPDDGSVDQNDLDRVLLNWGNSAVVGAAAVPEPSTCVVLGVGLLLGAGWRRLR